MTMKVLVPVTQDPPAVEAIKTELLGYVDAALAGEIEITFDQLRAFFADRPAVHAKMTDEALAGFLISEGYEVGAL